MFEIGTPTSGPELGRALLALQQQGASFCEQLDAHTFFRPQGPAWSPAAHIRHLRMTTLPICLAFRLPAWFLGSCFGTASSPSRPYLDIRDAYRASLVHNASAGVFAPRPQPAAAHPDERRRAILGAWQRTVLAFAEGLARWPEIRLDRYQLPHPRLGKVTLREMASFTTYHTAHHLSRIAERSLPPVPASGS